MVAVARQFDPGFDAASVEQRPSSGGKYLGLTLTVTATSREHARRAVPHAQHAPDGQGGAVAPPPAPGGMLIRTLGRQPYAPTVDAMRAFTEARTDGTPDELWLVEHDPVYTQGLAGKAEHLLHAGGIPVVPTNRGGQVTYHGPGQVVAYPLVDLRRLGIYVKEYVYRLENAVIKHAGSAPASPATGWRARPASTCAWPTPAATPG
jgi:hypothetical protein